MQNSSSTHLYDLTVLTVELGQQANLAKQKGFDFSIRSIHPLGLGIADWRVPISNSSVSRGHDRVGALVRTLAIVELPLTIANWT